MLSAKPSFGFISGPCRAFSSGPFTAYHRCDTLSAREGKAVEDSHVSDISDGTKSSCYPQSQALDSSQALVEPSHLAPLQPTTDVICYLQGKEQQQIQDSHVSDISDGTKSSCYLQSQTLDLSQAPLQPSTNKDPLIGGGGVDHNLSFEIKPVQGNNYFHCFLQQ